MSDMLSTPPARTTSASRVWMSRAAWTTDSIPEAQLRETECAGFSFGSPARSAMTRPMFAASGGVAMFPKIAWSTSAGSTFERAIASTAAARPRSVAETSLKSDPAFTKAVRAPSRMNAARLKGSSSCGGESAGSSRPSRRRGTP